MTASNNPDARAAERENRRLLIVDGHAYAYRAFFAIRRLSSPTGAPTNAIYGFIKMLLKLQASLEPTHQAVIWDGGLAAERVSALPGYKAQRPPMPTDLEQQLDPIVAYLRAANVASYCQEGVEADDWIATLARKAEAKGIGVVIASSDKDFMQLVGPGIGLVNPGDKTESVWTADQVRAKAGVDPSQVVDWLSLIGDSVDNIPGVPGVGPKTATELLQQFGSVTAIYQRLDEIKSDKLRASLRSAEPDVCRNQHLIRLREDLPVAFSPAELAGGSPDGERLRALYAEWGFKSLLRELEPAPAQVALI